MSNIKELESLAIMCIEETQKFNELDPIYKEFSEYENYEKELINSYAEMDNDYSYQ